MFRLILLSVTSSFMINLILVMAWRGSVEHVFILIMLFWLSVALAIASIIPLIFSFFLQNRSAARRVARGVFVIAVIVGSSLISLPLGWRVNRYDIDRAKDFCNRLRPGLEQWRRDTGRYPDRPFANPTGVRPPRLLQDMEFYHSFGDYYIFEFRDPSEIFGDVEFDSRDKTWLERAD